MISPQIRSALVIAVHQGQVIAVLTSPRSEDLVKVLNAQVLIALRDNVVTITKLFTISQAVSTWIHVEHGHGSRCTLKDKLDARSFQVCQVICAGLIPFLAEIPAEAVQVVESVLCMLLLSPFLLPQPPGSSATA